MLQHQNVTLQFREYEVCNETLKQMLVSKKKFNINAVAHGWTKTFVLLIFCMPNATMKINMEHT